MENAAWLEGTTTTSTSPTNSTSTIASSTNTSTTYEEKITRNETSKISEKNKIKLNLLKHLNKKTQSNKPHKQKTKLRIFVIPNCCFEIKPVSFQTEFHFSLEM